MNSLDCALKDIDTELPIIYLRLLFSLVIPFVYLIVFIIGILAFHYFKKKSKFPYYILTTTVIFLVIYMQPDLVSQTISLLSCRTIGNTSYILANVSYLCNTDMYN